MAKKRCIVIGLGNFGSTVAETLFVKGHEVLAIDLRGHLVDRISTGVSRAIVGDGTMTSVLQRIGAKNADVAVVSTGDDITASILATLALQDLEVKHVYVKVISREHARVMNRLGVRESIFPERDSALSLGARLSGTALLNYVKLGAGVSLQEMGVPLAWDGKTLRDLELRQNFGITVVACHDVLTDQMTLPPNPDAKLKDSDTLVVVGHDDDLDRAAKLK